MYVHLLVCYLNNLNIILFTQATHSKTSWNFLHFTLNILYKS